MQEVGQDGDPHKPEEVEDLTLDGWDELKESDRVQKVPDSAALPHLWPYFCNQSDDDGY